MGSKRLKAIVVEGNLRTRAANPDLLKKAIKERFITIYEKTEGQRNFGTAGGMAAIMESGDLPIKNWKEGWWEDAYKINGVEMAKKYVVDKYGCGTCVIKCGKTIAVNTPDYYIPRSAGVEYETMAGFGAICLMNNLEAVCKANELCNRYGIDTLSTSGAIAFAIETYKNGILKSPELDEIGLDWGNNSAILTLVKKIGQAEGIGELLGQGVKVMAEYLGQGTEDYAIHVKGLEFPMHDPRAYYSMAISYATSNRGACHLQGMSWILERSVVMPELGYDSVQNRFATEGKGILAAKMQNLCSMMDALKVCKFSLFGGLQIKEVAEWYKHITGWDMTVESLLLAGERMYNLKRMYNVKLGISRKDDKLPKRILDEPRGSGGAPEKLPAIEGMLDEYYNYRGWDNEGIPLARTLQRLGI